MAQNQGNEIPELLQIVIVGAGMAGLTCARQLLQNASHPISVTLLEASNVVGGRVQKLLSANANNEDLNLDAGAEFIHGKNHILWNTVVDYQRRGLLSTNRATGIDESNEGSSVPFEYEGLEPYFILAHADGGPEEQPTPQGRYGMYYIDGELVMYNDPKVQPLVDVLEAVLDPSKYDDYNDDTSLADALAQEHIPQLSDSLMKLCVAGYGNTAGCCDLSQLSIRQLMAFEQFWETHEAEGDHRPIFGMYRVVDAILEEIQTSVYYKNKHSTFHLKLGRPVEHIRQIETSSDSKVAKIKVVYGKGQSEGTLSNTIHADAVVVTVPPTRVPQLFDNGHDLPIDKQHALKRLGFADRVVKICCKFRSSSFWPKQVQSIVAAGQAIPELWLRKLAENYHVVVGYLVSTAASELVDRIKIMQQGAGQAGRAPPSRELCAGQIMLEQLSTIFRIPVEGLEQQYIEKGTQLIDWKDDFPYVQGGYMFPKVGMRTRKDLLVLAEKMMDNRVFFAGEATNTDACCTIQAAMETGIRAAQEINTRFCTDKKTI